MFRSTKKSTFFNVQFEVYELITTVPKIPKNGTGDVRYKEVSEVSE